MFKIGAGYKTYQSFKNLSEYQRNVLRVFENCFMTPYQAATAMKITERQQNLYYHIESLEKKGLLLKVNIGTGLDVYTASIPEPLSEEELFLRKKKVRKTLRLLRDNHMLSRQLLLKELGVSHQTLLDMMKKLIDYGLVSSSSNPHDRRVVCYFLTEKGVEYIKKFLTLKLAQ